MLPKRLIIESHLIPEQGLKMEGELSPEVFEVPEDDRLQCPTPLHYELQASLVGHDLLVQGRLETTLRCVCDRCLEPYEETVTADDVCHLINDAPDDDVDLTSEIREDIVISFPVKQLCSEDCAGLCSSCGQNLNRGDCDCVETDDSGSIWDVLDDFDAGTDRNEET